MDDVMLDRMVDHGGLGRRLDAYAEARLTPDLVATSRMRSRVLAVAHRQSALARADVALALVADPARLAAARDPRPTTATERHPRTAWRRVAALIVAAGLALSTMTGVALAARPGGGLYGARVWAETLALPQTQPERAIAELDRLSARISEITAATAGGDPVAAQAALLEYERIVDQAAADAERAGDVVAQAALGEGVARNIEVLSTLAASLPDPAADAVGAALERAIERSDDAVEGVKPGNGNGGNGSNAGGNGNGVPGGPNAGGPAVATDDPTATPTPKPTKTPKPTHADSGGTNNGGGQGPGSNNGGTNNGGGQGPGSNNGKGGTPPGQVD